MNVSVIICTWNSSRLLQITLDAFTQCATGDSLAWEIILVNNNCTDNTDAIVEDYRDRLPIVYVHESRQGLSHARMAGLKAASGELLLFTDDDVKPARGWIEAYWKAYQVKGAEYYFGGPIECEYEIAPPQKELLCLAPPSVRGLDLGKSPRSLVEGEQFIGPNWACPAAAIEAAGGFDVAKGLNPALKRVSVGEETDLMNRLEALGLSSWYVPDAGLRHFVPDAKCQLRHLADRAEAAGYERAESYPLDPARTKIGGVPIVMYKWALGHWTRWLLARITGSTSSTRHFIELRKHLGLLRGLRELK